MKAKNESEFLALKLRYETITIEEIEREWVDRGSKTLKKITGYGCGFTCSLCTAIGDADCDLCVYDIIGSCLTHDSYYKISSSNTPSELLTACRNRAIHMGKVWEKYVKQV